MVQFTMFSFYTYHTNFGKLKEKGWVFWVGLLLTCHMECGPCGSPGMLGVCLWLGYTQGCWHIPYLCSKMLLLQYVPA